MVNNVNVVQLGFSDPEKTVGHWQGEKQRKQNRLKAKINYREDEVKYGKIR